MSVLAAIAILALLIVVHELGHFTAARAQGIYANRFSIGFGPILLKYQGKDTEYAIRAFPLGGFVGFPDDDPDSEIPPNDPNLLRNRPVIDRAIVISAGVIANLIFAYLVLVLQFSTVGVLEAQQPGVLVPQLVSEVSQVTSAASQSGLKPGDNLLVVNGQEVSKFLEEQGSDRTLVAKTSEPLEVTVLREQERVKFRLTAEAGEATGITLVPTVASQAGLKPGDVVLSANGREFGRSFRERDALRDMIRKSSGESLRLQVKRGNQQFPITLLPKADPDGEVRIGVTLAPNGPKENPGAYRRPDSLAQSFTLAADEFQRIVVLTVQGFGQLISNFQKTANQVAGPVAIVAIGASIAKQDAASLFQFAALISINLAIINILPLPALDGGQLAFLLVEGVRGKPLPTKIQDGVMQTGLVLLLGLGIFLIIRDTANLWVR
ncbi:MAG: RIP metalloprotease RseP [Leptolyngbyaceae cyanobacterium bins.59]|nr:RIP metalloprotease RseP [Leptolyngbyaceae cyanobacterium bins.59]